MYNNEIRIPMLMLLNDYISLKKLLNTKIVSYEEFIYNRNKILKLLNELLDNIRIKVLLKDYLQLYDKLMKSKIKLVDILSKKYPKKLLKIKDPPLVIYYIGSLEELKSNSCIAVSGPRSATRYGLEQARKIGRLLAENGYSIITGLARGVDTQAHLGALEVNGKSFAVLATSLDNIYPPENKQLAAKISENGGILSENSPLKKIQKYDFVRRNRIISGLSDIVIIVEPKHYGGVYHQVKFALEQNKKILVLKPISEKLMYPFLKIVNMGATPINDPIEILSYI